MNKRDASKSLTRFSRTKKKFIASFVLFSFTFVSPISLLAQVADAPTDAVTAGSAQAPTPVKEDIIAGPSEKEWSLLGLPRFPEIKPVLNTPANEAATSPGTKISTEGEALVDSGSSVGTSALTSVAANKWLNSYSDTIRLPEPEHVSGAFSQDIPIVTPPGRNGVEPNLKLSYNSQNRDDENLFGFGWSLNIPVIERMNKSGVEDLYNQQHFVSSFDGELATTSSATYGAKFDDGSFRNYSFATSTSIWTMTDKAGVKYTFGTSTTGRLSNPNDSSQVYRWMLEEMRDTNGNFMKYEYTKDNGQIYPSRIIYTGNGAAGGPFEVSFLTESRSDNPISYKYGFQVKTLYRIKEVDIKFNDNLVKKYVLGFTAGHNGVKSLLQSVTETGYNETGTPITLSPMTFTYQVSNTSWPQTADSPWNLPDITDVNWKDTGFRVLGYNNNSQSDLLLLKEGLSPSGYEYQNSWSSIPVSQSAPALVDSSGNDRGSALVDVNGDGHTDIVLGKEGSYNLVYLRSGTSFATTTYSNMPYLVDVDGNDNGIRFGDFNGDGYADYLRGKAGLSYYLFLNKADGTGWANGVGVSGSPEIFVDASGNDYGARVMDVNGDGLDDIVARTDTYTVTRINFNLGGGTNWSISDIPNTSQYAGPQITGVNGKDIGTRMTDVNSDGLIDFVVSTPTRGIHFYINRGTGEGSDPWGWVDVSIGAGTIPYFLDTSDRDIGVRMVQANYDGIPDFVRGGYNTTKNNFISSGSPVDVLTSVTFPTGGVVSATYKGVDAETALFRVVQSTTRDPGVGSTAITTNYSFTGGQFQADWQNRKFRGFEQVEESDSLNNYMITNYHQGNGDNINSPYPWYSYAKGEYDDVEAKMYRPWRVQKITLGVGTNNTAINRWEKKDLGGGRTFVYLKDAIQYDYDLNSSHRDSASSFDYATSTGNLISTINWGEVSGNTSDGTWGTWSDTGSDKRTAALSYAAGGSYNVIGALSQSILTDQSATKISETKNYYDGLSYGSVDKGNLTKQEFWKSGTSYASTTKTYNSYGLVTQEKDGKGSATNYTYDTHNLYVATSTNALSQTRGFQYDYSSGKAKSVIDENNRVFQTVYDGLDRVKEEKQPDQTTPGTLVTKALYIYTDTPLAVSMKKTSYLNSATSTDLYEYKDGLGRTLQTRAQGEGSNFSARDFAYNNRGLLEKESLPYFSTGSAKTSPTGTAALYTNYTYDALGRVMQASNAVGNTSNAYDDWKVTTTDANGKIKDFIKDAYGNLATIVEHNGGLNYTTSYTYDGASNLTSITDALSNVRNFTYDGIGRRLTAQDLHATADGTYGAWTYSYDDAGNMTQKVDPKSQTVNYTYDALNRALTEDYTGAGGTEVAYTYDSCADGNGRLCIATTTDAVTTLAYNPLGLPSSEMKKISNVNYTTSYLYDRQGNLTDITYPDNSIVKYGYDSAGLLDTVLRKPATSSTYLTAISEIGYAPTGAITLKRFGNGVTSTYTYDPAQLYRLTNIFTTASSTWSGGGPLGLLSLPHYAFSPVQDILARATAQQLAIAAEAVSPELLALAAEEDPYLETPDTYKVSLKQKNTDAGEASVELLKDRPEVRLKKWNGEVDMGVSYGKVQAAASHVPLSNRVEWKGEKEEVHAYPLLAKEGMEDGGFEIEVYLKEKPTRNVFVFIMDGVENLDFFYQAPLTQEEIDNGTTRPENVVGSYAVYHKTKKDHKVGATNYATGKAFHIYRPKAIDAKGNKTWATLSYTNGALSVEVPQSFLDTATYPVRVDPTFGYTTAGASNLGVRNAINGSLFTSPTDYGSLTSISGYFKQSSSANAKLLIVLHSSLAIMANGITNGVSVTADGWYSPSFSTTPSLSANTGYVLGYITDNSRAYVMYDTGATDQGHSDNSNSYTTPTNPTDATHNTNKFSVYVTYTASGGGNQAPTAPTSLLTEGQTNPTNISDPTPELSAIYNDPDTSDSAIFRQIQVSTSSTFTSTYWDSGKAGMATTSQGARSPDISYAGTALASSTSYFWRIKFWDVADAAGVWSTAMSTFSLAASGGGGGGLATILQNISYTYDNVGNITNITDRSDTGSGKVVTLGYDNLYRLTSASTTVASSTPFLQTYSYSSIGNITNKSDIGSYTYAGTGYANPHAATSINGATYSYDNNGNLTSGGGWSYGWDYRDRLVSASNGTAITTYGYDHNNERVWKKAGASATTTYPNKYYNLTGATTTVHLFLPGGSLIATVETAPSGGGGGSATSTGWKTAGTINESTGFTNFTTTAIGSSDNSYATSSLLPDPLGRTSTFGFSIPTGATINGIEVTLEAKVGLGTIGIPFSLSWNNGTSFTATKSNTITTTEAVYTYGGSADTWGRTWTPTELANATFQVKVDPPGNSFGVSYDHIQAKVYYTTAGGGGGNATTTAYIHPDHLGGTNVATNGSGTVVQVLDYYPFGSERIASGQNSTDRHFIGERFDSESELNYLNSRYYSGDRGQFISQDPTFLGLGDPARLQSTVGVTQDFVLRDPQLMNSYSYGRNNPITNKDPTGNNPLVIAGVAGAAFAVGQQAYMDIYNGQFSGAKVYGTQAVIGGATGVGVALAAVSAPFTATGIGFLGAYSSSVYGDAYNPANVSGEIDQTKAVAQGVMSVATMGFGKLSPGIPGSYPKVSTLVNNFSQNPVRATSNFFFSAHGQRDILRQLSSTLGALLVELNRLQNNNSGSKDATPPAQSQKKTANRRRRKVTGEMAYDPNKKWIWQTFAFMLILPAFALVLTPKSDPMFYSLLFIIAMVVVIFTTLLRFGSLYLKDGMLTQEDLLKGISIKVGDINQIEVVRHGFWGGTYITTKNSKININHSLFDEETRSELIDDLLKINPSISVKE